jgi:division/cell wall cluster transcriptional repressor MraZ
VKLYRFSGATLLSIDEKGRALVPAEVRRKLDDSDTDVWVIKIGNNGKMWLYPERFYDSQVYESESEPRNEIDPSPEEIDRMIARSADIQRIKADKAGRILLPDLLMSLTGIARGDTVVLLGVFGHLQLWTKESYAERQMQKSVQAAKRAAEVARPPEESNT